MAVINEPVLELFNQVLTEITGNIRQMMEQLWLNWCHLGFSEEHKAKNIWRLVDFEKDFHKDVVTETERKIELMKDEIKNLQEETMQLSKFLSVEITMINYKEDMFLADYKREIENQISGYREQVKQRRVKMDRLMEWQNGLVDQLGVTMQELNEVPLPSDTELQKLESHLNALQQERDKRAEIFLKTQVEIKDIMEKLQIKPDGKFQQMAVSALSVDFKFTDYNMDCLAKLRQELQEKYEKTNNRVLELRERLAKLWECLEEDLVYRENFLHAHPGCHPDSEAAIREEIKRCDKIKRQKIQVFVANVRTKIKLMWDNLKYSQKEREEFVHYFQDVFTEDTLTLHELYLDKLTKQYQENKPILDLVLTRRELWTKMCELEQRATAPNRFHNRGGQLLQEEKVRKTIGVKLPKIEEQIRELVMEYEEKKQCPFTIEGKPLLQVMTEEWEARKAERQNKVSAARKQALTPTTPGLRSLLTSPLGKRDRTAAGLEHADSNKRPPNKRQLITGSATKAMSAVSQNLSAFKRSAITTVKRRVSGRLVARALDTRCEVARKKLDYGGEARKTPKVNGSILKHKRRSGGKRRSSSRLSMSTAPSQPSQETVPADPLMETTLLSNYSEFKNRIHEEQISRSSMVNNIVIKIHQPAETPKKKLQSRDPLTPKTGKENKPNGLTEGKGDFYTPNRLTRSAVKTNKFATPHLPLSAQKIAPPSKQNTVGLFPSHQKSPGMTRSKSHTHMVRNLPPII